MVPAAKANRDWRIGPALPALVFLAAFFLGPLADNGLRSVLPEAAGGGPTLARYLGLLTDGFNLAVIGQTLLLSLVVTAICVAIGYPVAYHLVRRAERWRGLIVFLLLTPLLTPIIMRTYGFQVLLARRGLVNLVLVDWLGLAARPLALLAGPAASVAALVHVLVPFMVLSIATVLQGVDRRLEESADILGASPVQRFARITLPLSMEGVATGAILVFMMANGSFVTLLLLGGGWQTLPLLIYQQFMTTRDFGMASAMSTILLALALVCLYAQLRLVRVPGAAR